MILPRTPSTCRWIGAVIVQSVLCSAGVFAADVHVVDSLGGAGSEYVTLPSAIDAAGPGDIVLLRTGTYFTGGTISGKSLSIVAEKGASVVVHGITVERLAPDQTVTVRGCTLSLGANESALVIRDNAGVVWVEDCRAGYGLVAFGTPGVIQPAIFVENSMRVVFRELDVKGTTTSGAFYNGNGGVAARLRASTVHAFASRFEGAPGSSTTGGAALVGAGGDGVSIEGGSTFFAGCEFVGGKGGNGVFTGGPVPCKPGQVGGDGLDATNLAIVRALDVSAQPGLGGAPAPSGGCGGDASGLALRLAPGTTYLPMAGQANEFSISSPEREATSHTLHAQGEPGASIVVLVSAAPAVLPAYAAAGALLVAPPIVAISFGALPPGGTLDVAIPAGTLPPAIDGITVYAQPLFFESGGARLAPGSAVVLLDAAI